MSMTATDIETMISDAFVLVEASKLSLNDEFMKYEPKTKMEEKFKRQLTEVIKKGAKDFWRPKYDPSFNEDGMGICFVAGKKPALSKSYDWWKKAARAFCPERHSRLGTKSEYVAFFGVLIKKLVESGWKVETAWRAACCDSKKLGHYWNSKNAKHDFEDTGSREICGFFDLANTFKILADDDEYCDMLWLVGGCYRYYSYNKPLAVINCYDQYYNEGYNHHVSVGWVIIPA